MKFATKLSFMLAEPFDLEKAEALSVEIHKAEEAGYVVSKQEDDLWVRLSLKIQAAGKD